jgi:peptide/nickel transport system substrate-binding protein
VGSEVAVARQADPGGGDPRARPAGDQRGAAPYDPARAKKLLADAGYPNGLDAGNFVPIPPFITTAEAATNFLAAVGIRTKIVPTERAAFLTNWREKKLRGLFMTAVGNSGNAASRVGEFYYSKGTYAYGGYPDIDELFQQQAKERDVAKREAILHRIQQIGMERAMFLPIMDYRTLRGVGPRVAEHALDAMPLNPFPAYEDIKLKN